MQTPCHAQTPRFVVADGGAAGRWAFHSVPPAPTGFSRPAPLAYRASEASYRSGAAMVTAAAAVTRAKVSTKTVPSSSDERTVTRPPCPSTIWRTM